jgi:CobQ-like glutamine amidotransferase family enzyme
MSAAVTLLQLYPDELGVAGDNGNVMALRVRLERAGVAVSVVRHGVGDVLPEAPDIVLVGNGPVSAIRNIYADLRANADALLGYARAGIPFFAYGSGAELLGTGITLLDGSRIEGLGIFDFETVRTNERKVGYILVDSAHGQIAGFEDNASVWNLGDGAVILGTVLAGGGIGDGKREGVVAGASIATQIGGPVLPLNPAISDALIRTIAARKGFDYATNDTHAELDRFAERARGVIVDNVKHVFSRI